MRRLLLSFAVIYIRMLLLEHQKSESAESNEKFMVKTILPSQSSNASVSSMRGANSRNYIDVHSAACHHNQLCGNLKSMVIDENASTNLIKVCDMKNSQHVQRRNIGLGNINNNKNRSNETKYSVPHRKLSQSLDLSGNSSIIQYHDQNKDHNYRNQSFMRRGVDESKTQREITRWSHDQSSYPYHANQRSQFSFELNEFDEEICKRTATRAYATQISLECDMEVAQCVHVTAVAHDRALFEHAQCVHSHLATAKEMAVSEWLKTKSKEEQTQYLSHHNRPVIPAVAKV